MRKNNEYTKFLEEHKNSGNITLLEDIIDNLQYINDTTADLIFDKLKDNNYSNGQLEELSEFLDNMYNNNYEEIDYYVLGDALEKEQKFYTREDLEEIIDEDLRENGINSSYFELREYLIENDDDEIFTFYTDYVSFDTDDIENSYYNLNEYLEDVFNNSPEKYTKIFLDKLENSYDKSKDIEQEEPEM